MRRIGLYLAVAAQAVSAPRLILAFLDVDGVAIPGVIEAILLGVTGAATAFVLSGGGAYLAHTLATPTKRGGWWKVLLAAIWFAMLGCAIILISPLMQSGMTHSTVAGTLHFTAAQWFWSVTAVVAVEIVAAGGMLADALRTDALPRRASQVAHVPATVPSVPTGQPETGRSETAGRAALLAAFLAANPYASLRDIADGTGVPKSSVARLTTAAGWHKNGNGWERVA